MKIVLFLTILPIVWCLYDNELNKPHKDKYVLHKNCEAQIHKQIDEEMHASLVYATMAAHFNHNSIARKGLAKFFAENSMEEREHAQKFINYLNVRGARFAGFDIKMPNKATWGKALDALEDALNLEKHVNNKLHHLHDVASLQCVDQHVIDKAKATPLYTKKFLQRELDIWPKLRHRHIIQVDNTFQIHDRIYVFMELAARGSVIEYVQSHGAVEEFLGQEWCKRMCQALRYCHKKGIAHRDLKCDNLLLDRNLQIKIGDFGFCCRTLDRISGVMIYSETYCGSSSYVAPEVINTKPYDPIPADVWSAGVCIYVILNNAMPFDDTNITKMHRDQLTRNWAFSSDVPSLSAAARKLIKRMLEPMPSERPTIDQVLNSSWMRMK